MLIQISKDTIRVHTFIFCILLISFISGHLTIANDAIVDVIKNKPLSPYYFLCFIIIGLILPITYRYLYRNKENVRQLLNDYLSILIGQILLELGFVSLTGKGVGVLIGFFYSPILVVVIMNYLWRYKYIYPIKIRLFGLLLVCLWTFNIYQIITNRLHPLLI